MSHPNSNKFAYFMPHYLRYYQRYYFKTFRAFTVMFLDMMICTELNG